MRGIHTNTVEDRRLKQRREKGAEVNWANQNNEWWWRRRDDVRVHSHMGCGCRLHGNCCYFSCCWTFSSLWWEISKGQESEATLWSSSEDQRRFGLVLLFLVDFLFSGFAENCNLKMGFPLLLFVCFFGCVFRADAVGIYLIAFDCNTNRLNQNLCSAELDSYYASNSHSSHSFSKSLYTFLTNVGTKIMKGAILCYSWKNVWVPQCHPIWSFHLLKE